MDNKYKDYISDLAHTFARDTRYGRNITEEKITNWINNFPKDSIVPYALLRTLSVITDEQIKACVHYIVQQIKASLYFSHPELSDAELSDLFREHFRASTFICACKLGDAASSASKIGRVYRDVLKSYFSESSAEKICNSISQGTIEHVYIIDDFVGTGSQMKDFFSFTSIPEQCTRGFVSARCSVECLIRQHPNVEFTIAAIVAHETGCKQLIEAYPNLKFLYAYKINDDYNLLLEQCALYDANIDKQKCCAEISELKKKYEMESKYPLNVPFGFENKFPNNALELFWWTKHPEWTPLLERPEDAEPT